jgi:hypothetical protein
MTNGKVEVDITVEGSIDARPTPEAQYVRHWPWEHRSFPLQAVLQVPQWVWLVCELTQVPLHEVMQPVEQIPLLPHTPRSSGTNDEHTAQVGPQASV